MIKKTIKYEDYGGNTRVEDFYFNLSEAELSEMELTTAGGLEEMMKNIIKARDTARMVAVFKEVVLKSYGVKSPDGRRFIKSKELSEEFTQTEAFTTLFMELFTDTDKASEFFNGLLPKKFSTSKEERDKRTAALKEELGM